MKAERGKTYIVWETALGFSVVAFDGRASGAPPISEQRRLKRRLSSFLPSLLALVTLPVLTVNAFAAPYTSPHGPEPFYPRYLISPMRDDIPYSPVGMGLVTSKAGMRIHPVTGAHAFHSGVDLGARLNQEVYNLLDGQVIRTGWRGALGYHVEVFHPYPYPGIRTICGHLNAFCVKPGEWVCRGRVLGYAGTTGRSTGVHVHYTVIKADTKELIDPMEYLALIPSYVKALKTAQYQAAIAYYKQNSKKNLEKIKPLDLDDEEEEGEMSKEKKTSSNSGVKEKEKFDYEIP